MSHSRQLGLQEHGHLPPVISNMVVPACLTLKGKLDLNKLRQAVVHVVQNQPNLSHGIAKVGETYKFVAADPNYEYFEILTSKTDWRKFCKKYVNQMLHEDLQNKPPIKVFFIPNGKAITSNEDFNFGQVYLIPVYIHFAGDGTNGMTLVNDILCVYEHLTNNGLLNYPKIPNPPSPEDMAKSFFDGGNDVDDGEQKYEETKIKFVRHCMDMYKKFNYFPSIQKDTNFTRVSLRFYVSTSEVYDKFISKCKEKYITVGAAFIAIQYFAYASFAFQEKSFSEEEIFMGCNIPINLRNRVPMNIAENCVNRGVMQSFISPGIKKETSFWKFAETIKREILHIFNNEFHLFDYSFIKETAKSAIVLENIQNHGMHVQTCVSNMKKYPHTCDYKNFVLESIHCVGGIWIENWDHTELMIYSTDKFNLSLIHRDGEENTKIAKYIFSLVTYLTENLDKLHDNFLVLDLIKKFPYN